MLLVFHKTGDAVGGRFETLAAIQAGRAVRAELKKSAAVDRRE
jgi:hypothetical protein